MIVVKLYGIFRKICGGIPEHTLNNCNSLAQVFSYLTRTYPQLSKYIMENYTDKASITVNNRFIRESKIPTWTLFKNDVIRFIPNISGAGDYIVQIIQFIIGALIYIFVPGGQYVGAMLMVSAVVSAVMMPKVVAPLPMIIWRIHWNLLDSKEA